MNRPTLEKPTPPSRTEIRFDLTDELTPEEIKNFVKAAAEAGAADVTEHFVNLTLRGDSAIPAA